MTMFRVCVLILLVAQCQALVLTHLKPPPGVGVPQALRSPSAASYDELCAESSIDDDVMPRLDITMEMQTLNSSSVQAAGAPELRKAADEMEEEQDAVAVRGRTGNNEEDALADDGNARVSVHAHGVKDDDLQLPLPDWLVTSLQKLKKPAKEALRIASAIFICTFMGAGIEFGNRLLKGPRRTTPPPVRTTTGLPY